MVRYQDIIDDFYSKLFLLEQWKKVYPLTEYYDVYLDACYGHKVRSFIQILGQELEQEASTIHIEYDLPCIPGLAEFLRGWNNFDLRGKYIYRATTKRYLDEYVLASTPFMIVNKPYKNENKYLSYWSVSPYTSNYFVRAYVERFGVNPKEIFVLVTPYDDNICSKDWYSNFTPEYTIIQDGKPINFGNIRYLRELEVRCFKYPVSRLIYQLPYSDFLSLMKLLPSKYVY
ncbi:conserved lipothrixviral protein [Sulfolobus islandicus filamentous virus 2]|uniref:Conserved lipothrixviral protein n=1 Tax=Sulfolobus islandicus filamentous virus 2 TaxID=1902331 RepID=A0A1D8BJB9_SIFV|nr:conserved lipothrixviral protein [Sulfolobus islandicus filamentous virus 2]